MPTPKCFVIQPFDGGNKFDKRYDEEFCPALQNAGLEAYRVDRDPAVEVPIDEIEKNIHDAAICLADISMDNPNVWYELGYAFALKKKVVLVCSDEREGPYPFDIRHRTIVKYETGSRSDLEKLQREITKRVKSLLKSMKEEEVAQTEKGEREGTLGDFEVRLLTIAVEIEGTPRNWMTVEGLKNASTSRGMSNVEFGVAFQKLRKREFLDERMSNKGDVISIERHMARIEAEWAGIEPFDLPPDVEERLVVLTEACWEWIAANMPDEGPKDA